MSPSARVTILIVNYKAAGFLEKCLSSLKRFLTQIPHEICVIDNGSADAGIIALCKRFPEVRLIRNEENRGFAAAINQGIRATTAPYVLWLNPDTEVMDGHLGLLLDYMDQHSEVGILGPQILNPDGSIQLSCRDFPSYEHYFFGRHSILTNLFPRNPISRKYLRSGWDHQSISEVDWVSGACLLHRRVLVNHIGMPDEGYFMYFEDVDFCRRAKQKGWSVRYHPSGRFLHHVSGSSRRAPVRTTVDRHRSNWRYYVKFFRRNPVKDAIIVLGLTGRCLFKILLVLLFPGLEKRAIIPEGPASSPEERRSA